MAEKYNEEYIRIELLKFGLFLISEYKNNKTPLYCRDENGFVVKININNLKKRGVNSFRIVDISNEYSIANINKWIEINNRDVKLLSSEYLGNSKKLKFKCSKDSNEFLMNWGNFRQGQGCPKCANNIKLNIQEIKERLKITHPNIEILDDSYINNRTKIKVKCKIDNHIWKSSYSNLNYGYGCPVCDYNRKCGETSPNWNNELTSTDRENKRRTEEYYNFIREVMKVRGYTCEFSGKKGRLHVHHLNGYHWFKEGRIDKNNVVLIHKDIHKFFHKLYGNKNNTVEQWVEFTSNYVWTEKGIEFIGRVLEEI